MSSEDIAIKITNLTKNFGRLRAVDHLSLEVNKGDIFGFLGPNGAGKSTTIRMMLGLMWPTEGEVEIMGHRVDREHNQALAKVGGIVETSSFYEYLSGRKNLEIMTKMSSRISSKRIDEMIELVGLKGREDDKVSVYSRGMKQRLGVAQALLPQSELLILDEPTEGLDPQGIKDVRSLIQEVAKNRGITVFLSSHLLYEVEQICNRVAIINEGKLVVEGEVNNLLGSNRILKINVDRTAEAAVALESLDYLSIVSSNGGPIKIIVEDRDIPRVNRFLVEKGFDVGELTLEKESLEDFFLRLTTNNFKNS